MSTTEHTLAQVQFKLSYIQADEHLRHLEDSLSVVNPRRAELNVLRRQFAGIMLRLDQDLEAERQTLAPDQPPTPPPKNGSWRRHARLALSVAIGALVLCALVFASVTAGAALVVAAITP